MCITHLVVVVVVVGSLWIVGVWFCWVKLFVFLKSLGICLCMCVVSDFLGFEFVCVLREFKNLCVCDVLGVKLLVIITRICMYVIFGGRQIACDFQKFKNLCVYDFLGVKLFVFFRRLRIVRVLWFFGLNCLCFSEV
jgi:hypothetical protein